MKKSLYLLIIIFIVSCSKNENGEDKNVNDPIVLTDQSYVSIISHEFMKNEPKIQMKIAYNISSELVSIAGFQLKNLVIVDDSKSNWIWSKKTLYYKKDTCEFIFDINYYSPKKSLKIYTDLAQMTSETTWHKVVSSDTLKFLIK